MEYSDYNDNELLSYISENNEDANEILYKKYEPFINKCIKIMLQKNPGCGIDKDDLYQEGLYAISLAINNFEEQKNIKFSTYVTLCIERRIMSLMKVATGLKQKALNESLSIDYDAKFYNNERFLRDDSNNPEHQIISSEQTKYLIDELKKVLTFFEEKVLDLKLSGYKYDEMATILNIDKKSIDNAMQRMRVKAKKVLSKINA